MEQKVQIGSIDTAKFSAGPDTVYIKEYGSTSTISRIPDAGFAWG